MPRLFRQYAGGACPRCHGLGRVYEVTERSMVPDDFKSIRERAIAAWPPAWHGGNLRDMLITLGYDVDRPWRELPKKPATGSSLPTSTGVPVYIGYDANEARRAIRRKEEPSYRGNFSSARRYVLNTFATTENASIKKRVSRYMVSTECPLCHGKRLRRESLSVKFAGFDIADISRIPLARLADLLRPYAEATAPTLTRLKAQHPEKALVVQRIAEDLGGRLTVLLDLGLGYLSLERSTPTLSPGELQRLRLATQVRSNLFGVVYVLDEPSAGLHPADTEALLTALDRLKASGNSLFVVEHEVDVIRHADWVVDVGPGAGELGGHVLYSGSAARVQAGRAIANPPLPIRRRHCVKPNAALAQGLVAGAWRRRNNIHELDVDFPLGVFTTVTGVSGSGKSSLVSQVLVELIARKLGHPLPSIDDEGDELERTVVTTLGGRIASGMEGVMRLVVVDQKAIGRTPRSNLATYTGLFDYVRKIFAASKSARVRHYDAGRFSFNVPKAVARPARAKALFASNCCSCPVCMHRAQVVMALATTPKPLKLSTATRTSPPYLE